MSEQEMTWGKAIEAIGQFILKLIILAVPGAIIVGAFNLLGFTMPLTFETWFGSYLLFLMVLLASAMGSNK